MELIKIVQSSCQKAENKWFYTNLRKPYCTKEQMTREDHLLLAISLDKFVKQVIVDSTTIGFGLVSIPSPEPAFCLWFSLDLYYFVSLFSSWGWRTPICSSDKNWSCENETNKALVTLRGFLAPIISILNFVKLPVPSTIVKHILFPTSALHSFFSSHLKLPAHSSCSGWHLRLHLSSASSVKTSLFLSAFISIFNQYPHHEYTSPYCSLLLQVCKSYLRASGQAPFDTTFHPWNLDTDEDT